MRPRAPTPGRFRCDCCGEDVQGYPMADGDDLDVDVCRTCDGTWGDRAYFAAVLRRAIRRMRPEVALHIATSVGQRARRRCFKAWAKRRKVR